MEDTNLIINPNLQHSFFSFPVNFKGGGDRQLYTPLLMIIFSPNAGMNGQSDILEYCICVYIKFSIIKLNLNKKNYLWQVSTASAAPDVHAVPDLRQHHTVHPQPGDRVLVLDLHTPVNPPGDRVLVLDLHTPVNQPRDRVVVINLHTQVHPQPGDREIELHLYPPGHPQPGDRLLVLDLHPQVNNQEIEYYYYTYSSSTTLR